MDTIVLVNAPISVCVPKASLPPLPLMVIGRCLKEVGETVALNIELLDLDLRLKQGHLPDSDEFYRQAARQITESAPRAALFTVHGANLSVVLQLAQEVKQRNREVTVILGGVASTLQANDIITHFDAVDLVIKGEGEPAISPLVTALLEGSQWSDIPACVYRENGQVVETASASELMDFAFPSPDYDLVDLEEYRRHNQQYPYIVPGLALVEPGRGCRFRCSFCAPNAVWGGRVRQRPFEDIANDMAFLASRGFNFSFFTQDNLDNRFLVPFCHYLIEQENQIPWGCYSRLDKLSDDTGELMAKAGCRLIFAGIESPNSSSYTYMNKKLKNEFIVNKLVRFNDLGIHFICSFMAGFPQESVDEFEATLRSALHCSAGQTEEGMESLLSETEVSSLPKGFSNFATIHPLAHLNGTHLHTNDSEQLRLTPFSLQSDSYGSYLFGLDDFYKKNWRLIGGNFVTHLSEDKVRFYYPTIRIFDLLCGVPFQLAWLVKQNGGQLLQFINEIINRISIDTVLTVPPSTLETLLEEDIQSRYGLDVKVASRREAPL